MKRNVNESVDRKEMKETCLSLFVSVLLLIVTERFGINVVSDWSMLRAITISIAWKVRFAKRMQVRVGKVIKADFLEGSVYELRSGNVITMNINAGKFEQNRNIDVSLRQLWADLNWTNAG